MTKEENNKILKALAEDRNNYARDCQERIEKEYGKITGADYMFQRFLDILETEVEPQESENKKYLRFDRLLSDEEIEAERQKARTSK